MLRLGRRKALSKGAPTPTGGRHLASQATAIQSPLSREFDTLDTALTQLEDHLSRVAADGAALRKDLAEERTSTERLKRAVNRHEQRICSCEDVLADQQELLVELGSLSQERIELATSVRHLEQRINLVQQECGKLEAATDRWRVATKQTTCHLDRVETQFEQAAQLVGRVKSQQVAVDEGRADAAARLSKAEELLRRVQEERDSLFAQMRQSQGALDGMRRRVSGACPVHAPADAQRVAGRSSEVGSEHPRNVVPEDRG